MTACDICAKGVQYGHNVRHTHSGQWMKRATKTRRLFIPNLHKGKVLMDGVVKSVKACASCMAQFKVPASMLLEIKAKRASATASARATA